MVMMTEGYQTLASGGMTRDARGRPVRISILYVVRRIENHCELILTSSHLKRH